MVKLSRGELEALVMDRLWSVGSWMTPADVQEALEDTHPVAYTTAMTILARLWKKGRLERRPAGRAFAYRPTESRDEWAALRMSEVLDAAGDRSAALAHFLGAMSTAERKQVRTALERKRRR